MHSYLIVAGLLPLVFLFGCSSTKSDKNAAEYPGSAGTAFDLQGHRGARGLMPENSIPGFIRALELEVTTLEMDIVISADSQVVVSHEPWFSRHICLKPSGERITRWNERSFRIFDMSYEEVAAFDCGSRGHREFPEQKTMEVSKPLLRDVITETEAYLEQEDRSPVRYNIETKTRPAWDDKYHPSPETVVELLYDLLQETGTVDRTLIQSFDMRPLRIAREIDSTVDLSLLVGGNRKSVRAHVEKLGFTPEVYSPNHKRVRKELVHTAHELGMKVIPWTVNELARMKELRAFGVDGLITDYPNRGRRLLQ
jgi:glycerophosphoryl diester phosphodiesterase